MNKNGSRGVIRIFIIIAAGAFITASVVFAAWWFGAFIPKDIVRHEYDSAYGEGRVSLEAGRLCYRTEDLTWRTDPGVIVQDLLIRDIDRDGAEEVIALAWKHGSFGDHTPYWKKGNDMRLEQHVFIYRNTDKGLSHVWMSSSIGKDVIRISGWGRDKILLDMRSGEHDVWIWQDFGLKYAGECPGGNMSVLCAGDNLVHPVLLQGNKYKRVYEKLADEIAGADMAAVNQETVLVDDPGLISDYPSFALPSVIADDLADTGFDVITLANNHMLDKGMFGLDSTVRAIERAYERTEAETEVSERIYAGVNPSEEVSGRDPLDPYGSIGFTDCHGIRCACIAYTYGTNGIKAPEASPYAVERLDDEERIKDQIAYAKPRADFILAFVHWGEEYSPEVNEEQRRKAEMLVSSGCDAVVGSHPHVMQDMDILEGPGGIKAPVFYSLGNLVTSANDEEQRRGGLARFTLTRSPDGLCSVDDPSLETFQISFDR